MFTKLTALLAVMALMVGLSFGIKDMTGASALAEEAFPPVAEAETRLQDAGEEIISRETEEEIVPQGSEEEIIPQEPEEEIVPQEPEEEIVPREPEEEIVPQEPEEETDEEESKYKYTDLYDNEKLLLKAIWLTDAQIKKYGDILTELPEELAEDTSYETYLKDCKARAASACYEFEPDGKGFSAKIDLEKDNLVFFSIPYDKGFTAYVDGQKTEIEKVFDGLSAVYVPAGDHSIRFDYRLLGLKEGMAVTTVCLVLFALYCCGCFVLGVRRRRSPAAAIAAEQTSAEALPENASEAACDAAKEEPSEEKSAEAPHDEE